MLEMYECEFAKCKWEYKPLENFEQETDYFKRLNMLREYYSRIQDEIRRSAYRMYDAYPVDWNKIFTPIETYAWHSIRCKGGMALYPQYPVNNYFIDFGCPALKVGLELDGAAYHNKEKDRIRDCNLQKEGWRIYRISGSEMNKAPYDNPYTDGLDEDEQYEINRQWILETGDGIIEAIRTIHFERPFHLCYDWYFDLCNETLKNHRLI